MREKNMNWIETIKKVSMENIYQHVLNLEGVRHPIDTPENLNKAADYIKREMEKCGISVREQEFKVENYDDTFQNIEGWIGDEGPSAVLVAHYDTVFNSPGANDDATGIGVILEVARVLAKEDNPPNVRFLGVTLEEGTPALELKYRALAQKYEIKDNKQRYKSAIISQVMQKHGEIIGNLTFSGGKSMHEAICEANSMLQDQMPENLRGYLEEYENIHSNYNPRTRIGGMSRIGSSVWVDEALEMNKEISYYICLDEIGTTFNREYSQSYPPIMLDMIQTYKVDMEKRIANFEMIITNTEEGNVAKALLTHCKNESIDLPYVYLNMNMNFNQVVENLPKSLSSDHAPFMRAGIPGIFMFDSSLMRNTFVHTPGDTSDKLDFNLITKICKAIIATILDPKKEG